MAKTLHLSIADEMLVKNYGISKYSIDFVAEELLAEMECQLKNH
ncbi:MAG: hypothetical protein ACLU2J_04485 [Clostridia bacterium]